VSATSDSAKRRVRIGSPAALLAAVPVLLGFQPGSSIVVVGTEPPRARVRLTLRYNLPDPPDARLAAGIARHAASVLTAQSIETAVAVGYGPGDLVTPIADAIRGFLPKAGITVTEFLRAEDRRYWSYACTNTDCCPSDGTPFDPEAYPAAVKAVAGNTPVLASREELAATVAPVMGEAAESMYHATRRAEEHARRLIARIGKFDRRLARRRALVGPGLQAVSEAIGLYRAGKRFASHNQAAWLALVLEDLRIRDDAWSRMDPRQMSAHLRLWTDLTRLARGPYAAAPASLLAFVAWQSGNGALANVALDRALSAQPDYSMADLLRRAVDAGAPPSLARLPMTPEQVAASYDLEENEDDSCENGTGDGGEDIERQHDQPESKSEPQSAE
jgi:hypothetical protein